MGIFRDGLGCFVGVIGGLLAAVLVAGLSCSKLISPRGEGQQATLWQARAEVKSLQDENLSLKDENKALEKALSRAMPDYPAEFSPRDLRDGSLVLQRVFSTVTAGCFDVQGLSRCLYHRIGATEGSGFLLYRANRRFRGALLQEEFFDNEGRQLQVLTHELSVEVAEWEERDPFNSLRVLNQ